MYTKDNLALFLEAFKHTGIYIIDKKTMEVYYENATAQKYTVKNRIGQACYLVHGNKSKCHSCPLRKQNMTSYVRREDIGMLFILNAIEVVFDGKESYAIFVRKQKEINRQEEIDKDQLRRMNRALNSSVLAYCEVNMDTMKCSSIQFLQSGTNKVSQRDYKEHLKMMGEKFVHKDDKKAFLSIVNEDYLKRLSADSDGASELSVKYRTNAIYDEGKIVKTTVYMLRDELPHYASIITTEVTAEEERERQLVLYNEITKKVLVVFQFNITKNLALNGVESRSRSANQTKLESARQFNTVDEFCEIMINNILDGPEKDEAVRFFNRQYMLEEYQSGKSDISCKFKYNTKDGSYEWIMMKMNMVRNPLTGDVEGILYSEEIDKKILEKNLIRQVIDNDYDYIILIDLMKNFAMIYTNEEVYIPVTTNDAQAYIVEYLRRTYVGDDLEEMIRKNKFEYIKEVLKHKEKYEFYYYNKQKDGKIKYKKGTYSYPKDDKRYLIFSRIDNTETIEEQKRVNKKLEQALVESANATKAKSDFFSRMSHDIRTPMNAIIGLTSLTLDEVDNTQEVKENLTKIRQASEFLLGLVNDILDMAKIEDGAIELKKVPYRYTDFLSNLKTMFEPMCRNNGIELHFEDMDKNLTILTDKVRLNQIFFNILSNAVKYTPEGGCITYRMENVEVKDGYITGDYIISDNGIGMTKEYQNNMFKPFTQEDNSITPNVQGTGLGLSITKSLVEMMGGSISIESAKEVGTTVRINLTLEIANEEINTKSIQEIKKNDEEVLNGRRILLVEDQPLNFEIAKKLLEKKHMIIYSAENGQIAVEKFVESDIGFFDAILMDIRMPVMNGLEAAQNIRKLDREDAKTVPIIAMTANAYAEDIQQSLRAGMNEHLAKPINPNQMYEALSKWIGRDN